MFTSALGIVLLLIYFWYMTYFPNVPNVSKPTQSSLEAPPKPPTQLLKAPVSKFQFHIDSQIVWKDNLPDSYNIFNGQFVMQDACHGKADGTLVPAANDILYEYIQKDKLISKSFNFEPDSLFMLQDKNPFYFSCQQSRIHELHMCPPGQYFRISACHIIDQCAGRKDGKTFADPFDIQRFFECHHEEAISKVCPPDTFFAYDKCHVPSLVGLYCHVFEKPRILDYKTLIICREGKITYEVCPPGYRYFESPKCEPEACVGKPNGHRMPLPKQQIGPLSFSPGYMECMDGKVASTHTCPQKWDSHLSKGDNLTHVPLVFDGTKCTIPEFCVNVTSSDPDVIVPVHEFTKHVRNWIYSENFDRVKGYRCEGTTRKRVAMDPGQIIHPKRFKATAACDGTVERVVVASSNNQYFDCNTHTVETCPANEFFDGLKCRQSMPWAFQYDNLQLFQLDSLREDNWMEAWDYDLNKTKIILEPCTAPESQYISAYHVCAHPDCTLYPWLVQIPFQIALRDGSVCTFDDQKHLIQKEQTDDRYLYWSQRLVDQENLAENCTPGQNIQSGHFVFDKTIFATCNEQQPFVFCPSSSTKGITLITGKTGTSAWACVPPSMEGIIPPYTKVHFTKYEVQKLLPATIYVTEVKIDGKLITILPTGHTEDTHFYMETLDQPVKVEYKYRITHPPEAVWPEDVSKFDTGSAFLTKGADFTQKPVTIPRYGIKDAVSDFKLT